VIAGSPVFQTTSAIGGAPSFVSKETVKPVGVAFAEETPTSPRVATNPKMIAADRIFFEGLLERPDSIAESWEPISLDIEDLIWVA
jgi:hypothetical protein